MDARPSDAQSSVALEMRMLSSGEKQIVSLFSHLFFSGESTFFVIIDEPELSLSVPWQRRFLPDILGRACAADDRGDSFSFRVENQLEAYVRSLRSSRRLPQLVTDLSG